MGSRGVLARSVAAPPGTWSEGSGAGTIAASMAQRSPYSSPSEEALRDLLGFVRAIYRARQAEGVSRLELRRIESVGRGLARAMAGGSPEEAEAAARAVSDIVGPLDAAEPVIHAAQAAIRERRRG